MSPGTLEQPGPHPAHVRVGFESDRIEAVDVTVVPRDDDLEELDVDRQVLGYIYRAGKVFVALAGERLDRAEECGQSLLWDTAAADLVRQARHDGASCRQCSPLAGSRADDRGPEPVSRASASARPDPPEQRPS